MIADACMILCALGLLVVALIDLHQDRKRQLAELDEYLEQFPNRKG
jgi:hypothetical protein